MSFAAPSRLRLYVVWLFLALVWGSSWSVLKVAFRDVPPFAMLGARTLLASVACLGWAWSRGGLRRPAHLGWLAFAILSQGVVMNGLLFWGGNRLDSGLTALLFATTPLWTAATVTALGWERLRMRTLAGIGLGLAGLAWVILPALKGQVDLPGVVAILTGALVCGGTAGVIKRHSGDWDIPTFLVLQFAVNAAFAYGMHALLGEPAARWTAPALGSLLYLALIGSVATYAGVYWLYRHMSAVSTTMLVLADAAFALLLGALWLGEPMSLRIIGAALGVLGGFLLTLERKED